MRDEILLKYITGEITVDELKQVVDWISEKEENKNYLFELEQLWRTSKEIKYSHKNKLDAAFQIFANKHLEETPQPKHRLKLLRVLLSVASIFLIAALSVGVYEYISVSDPIYTSFEVPRGQRAKLTLNDGSVVWLNAESKLTYSDQFGKDSRNVKLEGEAFFEVTKDSKHPFIVNSKDLDITVLGTKFNVRAYYEDFAATVSLISGKVQVENKSKTQKEELLPRQELVYENGQMTLYTNRSADLSSSWVDGELHFDNEPLTKIIKSLERRFDVSITLMNPSLEQTKFTCRVRQNATVTDVLELLKKTRKISYKEENSKIIIQ